MFADEPTGNLDSRSGAEILTFMREAVDDLGQTTVMVTHDPIVAGYADRAVFLADGKIVDEMLEPTTGPRARPYEELRRVRHGHMWRVTVKGLLAKKLRLVLTSIAVVLGVAFMSGTFVLTDTLGAVFDDLFSQQAEDIDAVVRAQQVLSDDEQGFAPRNPVPESLLATVESVDGVARGGGFGVRDRQRRRARRRHRAERRRTDVRVRVAVASRSRASTTSTSGSTQPRAPDEIAIDREHRRRRRVSRWVTRSTSCSLTGEPGNVQIVGHLQVRVESGSLAGATLTGFEPGDRADSC